jgi:hypothetical protein
MTTSELRLTDAGIHIIDDGITYASGQTVFGQQVLDQMVLDWPSFLFPEVSDGSNEYIDYLADSVSTISISESMSLIETYSADSISTLSISMIYYLSYQADSVSTLITTEISPSEIIFQADSETTLSCTATLGGIAEEFLSDSISTNHIDFSTIVTDSFAASSLTTCTVAEHNPSISDFTADLSSSTFTITIETSHEASYISNSVSTNSIVSTMPSFCSYLAQCLNNELYVVEEWSKHLDEYLAESVSSCNIVGAWTNIDDSFFVSERGIFWKGSISPFGDILVSRCNNEEWLDNFSQICLGYSSLSNTATEYLSNSISGLDITSTMPSTIDYSASSTTGSDVLYYIFASIQYDRKVGYARRNSDFSSWKSQLVTNVTQNHVGGNLGFITKNCGIEWYFSNISNDGDLAIEGIG